ncbi:protein translocase subunit SecF [Candidatus Woesearchaeota archaeon]|nr:protein translocase subunit SecF [Candidatus Woesearchaeota archaeon]
MGKGISKRKLRRDKSKPEKAQRPDEGPMVKASFGSGHEKKGVEIKPDSNTDYKRSNRFLELYDKQYKKLLIIPFVILLFAIGQLVYQSSVTGDFMNKGVSLKGGVTITVPVSQDGFDILEFEKFLKTENPDYDINARAITSIGSLEGVLIESDASTKEESDGLISSISKYTKVEQEDMSINIIGSSLGASFFTQTFYAMIIAFIFMGGVVFLYFRTVAPSLAVILAAFSDIVVTLAIVNVLGIKLSTAGIAAFLMLIGYSIDTDILLSTRVLKQKEGDVFTRVVNALKTGLTMNITTLIALFVAMILSDSEVLSQIMTILFIGLLVDIINTWIQNVGILRIYLERTGAK